MLSLFSRLSLIFLMVLIAGCAKSEIADPIGNVPEPKYTVESFEVGAAKVDITPDFLNQDVVLAGMINKRKVAGLLDPLYVRAIIIKSGNIKIGFVSLEQLYVTSEMYDVVLNRVKSLGLTALILQATHTQSGEGQFVRNIVEEKTKTGSFQAAALEKRVSASEIALRIADETKQDAFLVFETSDAVLEFDNKEIVYNKLSDGSNADDARVERLMFFSKEETSLIAQMMFFSVFPQILHDENTKISGDLPGRLSKLAEADFPHTIAIACPSAIADTRFNAEFVNIFNKNRTNEEMIEIYSKRLYNCFYSRKTLNKKIKVDKTWQWFAHEKNEETFADEGLFYVRNLAAFEKTRKIQMFAFGDFVLMTVPFAASSTLQNDFLNSATNWDFKYARVLSCCNSWENAGFAEKITGEYKKTLAQIPKLNK